MDIGRCLKHKERCSYFAAPAWSCMMNSNGSMIKSASASFWIAPFPQFLSKKHFNGSKVFLLRPYLHAKVTAFKLF